MFSALLSAMVPGMQVMVQLDCGPEEYVAGQRHRRVAAPSRCPNCGSPGSLEALGYYARYTTDAQGRALEFEVRRFECASCGHTVSCLPDFAQPYRVLNNTTIEAYFRGERMRLDVRRNEDLLRRYWRRFVAFSSTLRKLLGGVFSRAPPIEKAEALWQQLLAACQSLAACTCRLVREYRTTCFGKYRCHQPRLARSSSGPA